MLFNFIVLFVGYKNNRFYCHLNSNDQVMSTKKSRISLKFNLFRFKSPELKRSTSNYENMDQLLNPEVLKKLTPEQQSQIMASIKQEAAIANLQTLVTVIKFG